MRRRNTVGTDPEFFLRQGKKFVSSQNAKVQGTKHDPVALPGGGTIQRDNVAVEFATVPAKNSKDFVESIRSCLKDTKRMLPAECVLAVEASVEFDPDQLQDPEAQEFGCEPDFNAYTISVNEKPWCGDSGFRSCGAHIHVGGLAKDGKPIKGLEFLLDFNGKILMVKAMDLFHGVISTKLDNSEAAIKRRELYGKAGCHRPTDYGVEYRVLSNYWMKSPQLVMLMDSLTQDAIALIKAKKLQPILDEVGEGDLQNVINNGDTSSAEKIIEDYIRPNLSSTSVELYELCLENISKYSSIEKEWGL